MSIFGESDPPTYGEIADMHLTMLLEAVTEFQARCLGEFGDNTVWPNGAWQDFLATVEDIEAAIAGRVPEREGVAA